MVFKISAVKKITLALLLLCALTAPVVAEQPLTVHHFWGEGCPVCTRSKPFLEGIAGSHPRINLKLYEVWRNKENAELFKRISRAYGSTSTSVPVTVIGDNIWIGYTQAIAEQIKVNVERCLAHACVDPMEKIGKPPTPHTTRVVTADETVSPGHDVCVHIFLREHCIQCEQILSYIDTLSKRYNVILQAYDVLDKRGSELYEQMKEQYQVTPAAFPVVFIGEWFLVGDRAIRESLPRALAFCARESCPCPIKSIRASTPRMPTPKDITPEDGEIISIDVFGRTQEIDVHKTSLPLFTLLIAAADSFNPCSFYILLILLSLITRTGSRKRMLLVGGIFISLSGIIYFLFTAAWLNLWFVMGRVQLVTLIAGLIAILVAVISMKDFFFFKKGISLGIPESAKPKIFERMRHLLESPSLPAVIVGTVVLGILVNLYELLCTPGFPLVYTRVLTLHDLPTYRYYSYLVLYNLIYIVPLTVILVIFTVTFGQKKLTEEQGKILKLISGLMMLFLGLALIFNPKLLENFVFSAGILAAAVVVGWMIIFITKHVSRKDSKRKKAAPLG